MWTSNTQIFLKISDIFRKAFFICIRGKHFILQILHAVKSLNWFKMKKNKNYGVATEVFCSKGVLRNFTKFTGKHLCQRLFFNKVAGLRPATSLKKRLWHRCFPMNFVKFSITTFFKKHIWWLLLKLYWYIGKVISSFYFCLKRWLPGTIHDIFKIRC